MEQTRKDWNSIKGLASGRHIKRNLAVMFIAGILLTILGMALVPKQMKGNGAGLLEYAEGTSLTVEGTITDFGLSGGERGENWYTLDDELSIYTNDALGHTGEQITVDCKVKKDSDGEKYLGEGKTSFLGFFKIGLIFVICGVLLLVFGGFLAVVAIVYRKKA